MNASSQLSVEYNPKEESAVQHDPNFLFLDTTLLSNSRHRKRKSTAYFSARSWRAGLKNFQIMAMRNLKSAPQVTTIELVGRQVALLASEITNGKPYDFVTSVPSGDLQKKENFASLIARSAACELELPFLSLLRGGGARRHSTSHPKQSMHFRPRYSRDLTRQYPGVGRFGILVDDVATSGVHFERCVSELRRNGISVVCVAWVS